MSIQQLRANRRAQRLKGRDIGDPTALEEAMLKPHHKPRFRGPGAALRFIIKDRFGATACGACIEMAAEMDQEGPDWCRENVKDLAQRLHDNVTTLTRTHGHNWLTLSEWLGHKITGLHFHRQLISEACNLYETTSLPVIT